MSLLSFKFFWVYLLFASLVSTVSSCLFPVSEQEFVGKRLGVTLPECNVLYYENTHSGNGDGERRIIFEFTPPNAEELADKVKGNANWQPLPMTGAVSKRFGFGKEYKDTVAEGYWFFYDQQTEKYFLDEEAFDRAFSHDYHMGVFDTANFKLYYYDLNT